MKPRAHIKHFNGELNHYLGGDLFPLGLFHISVINSIPHIIISPKNVRALKINWKHGGYPLQRNVPQLNVREFLTFSMDGNEGLELAEMKNLMAMYISKDKNSIKLAKDIFVSSLSFSNIAEVNYKFHNYMINNLRIRPDSLTNFKEITNEISSSNVR